MSRALAGALLLLAPLMGCDRDEPNRIPMSPAGGSLAGAVGEVHLAPGPERPRPATARNPYADDPGAIREGEQLYLAYNCGACHGSRGGGGMGPPLRDETWIYGGDPISIYRSIMEGRPEGMPTWQGMIPEDQAWKIIAYIQSMGGAYERPPTLTQPGGRSAPHTGTDAPRTGTGS